MARASARDGGPLRKLVHCHRNPERGKEITEQDVKKSQSFARLGYEVSFVCLSAKGHEDSEIDHIINHPPNRRENDCFLFDPIKLHSNFTTLGEGVSGGIFSDPSWMHLSNLDQK